MKAAFAFVFALSAALTLATPAPIAEKVSEAVQAREYCPIGPPVASVVDRIYRAARARGVNSRVVLAMFQTAAVESNFNNPRCGDQDSVGVFQARTSQGWGTIDQIMNIEYTTNRFLDVCIPTERSHPGLTTGQIAQLVQRSEFPTRYDQKIGVAREQLNLAVQRNGGYNGGGSTNVGTNPNNGGGGGGNGGSNGNSGSGTSGNCNWSVTVAKGQTCGGIASKNGVSLDTIYKLNGSVNKGCTNLQVGQKICLKKGTSSSSGGGNGTATVPGNLASGTTKSCSRYWTVKSGQNCSQLAKSGNISLSSFYTLNNGVNKSCGNLAIGKAYCISA